MKNSIYKLLRIIPIVLALIGCAAAAHAIPVVPVSYDMPNGSGISRAGMFNYWDSSYTGGSGNTMADGAQLTGGSGKLTDGIIATESWAWTDPDKSFHVSQHLDRYVGWTWGDPTITFHFGTRVNIDNMTFYVDNPANDVNGNPQGGVAAPIDFRIGGTKYLSGFDTSVNNVPGTGPVAINIDNLGLDNIQELAVTIDRDINEGTRFWLFVSEVTFDNGIPVPVPEPSTLILFGAGIAGLALLRNRRKA